MCGNYSPTNAVTRSPRKGSSKKKKIFRRKLHFDLVLDDIFLRSKSGASFPLKPYF